ncbi:hypothetical protein [Aeromicrobium sp. Leaf350]|uniref:hypothetical protein n=1 Tax=Aeromicrobium sp. Leaf350 TaxID=2876565 RepID=UPI001E576162|nr:hypothetical protein [Aeromicrobium sp. Leaf350]
MKTEDLERSMAEHGSADIPTSRVRCGFLALLGVVVVVLGFMTLNLRGGGIFTALVGLLVTVFGLVTTVVAVRRAVTREPVLHVSASGIECGNVSAAWEDITWFELYRIRLLLFRVVVHARDPAPPTRGDPRHEPVRSRSRASTLPAGLVVGPVRLRRWLEEQRQLHRTQPRRRRKRR